MVMTNKQRAVRRKKIATMLRRGADAASTAEEFGVSVGLVILVAKTNRIQLPRKRGKRITASLRRGIAASLRKGLNSFEVAEAFDVSYGSVNIIARGIGIAPGKRSREKRNKQIETAIRRGEYHSDIVKRFGCSSSVVYGIANRAGIKLRRDPRGCRRHPELNRLVAIRILKTSGYSFMQIAKLLRISKGRAHQLLVLADRHLTSHGKPRTQPKGRPDKWLRSLEAKSA